MNRDEIIKNVVNKWTEKAEKDLLTARRELSFKEPITDTVCFHCQQAVEKYLKAFLVYHQIYFTKTHRIMDLLELCSTVDASFKTELETADNLTDYAVEIRYPEVWLEPTIEDAQEAFEIAEKAKGVVLSKIKPSFNKNAFTMTEILIVLAIMAILSLAAVPAFMDFLGHNKLKSASLEIVATFRTARQLAITKRKNYKVIINDVNDTANNLYFALKIYQDSEETIENWRKLISTVKMDSCTFDNSKQVPYPNDGGTLTFKPIAEFCPDGHMKGVNASLVISEIAKPANTMTITVYNTTGSVKVQ